MIERINGSDDLKKLSIDELKILADEIRHYILDTVENNGGHLSSNLGVIELTIAMLYVFDEKVDKFVFDVGHQTYAYKILTGRRDEFATLRQFGGISGFSDCTENTNDSFVAGHSSNSISAGVGLAKARDLKGEKHMVISVIGDGALTGGEAFEGFNNITENDSNLIIVLNDNQMAISKNVGQISQNLAKIRFKRGYKNLKKGLTTFLEKIPLIGKGLRGILSFFKGIVKRLLVGRNLFLNFDLQYVGIVDGHNLEKLIKTFKKVSNQKHPILLHIDTQKGNGFCLTNEESEQFHGVSKKKTDADFHQKNGEFSKTFGEFMLKAASENDKVVAITSAMAQGTGLSEFAKQYPKRFFDTGIAEQHAVTFSSALAKEGLLAYFAVYSTFLQRAFDQVICDMAINKLPLKIIIDRAGIVGNDGKTHNGVFDVAYLSLIPNVTIFSPKDKFELQKMLEHSLTYDAPLAIRYNNASFGSFPDSEFSVQWEILQGDKKSKVAIVAEGNRMNIIASQVCKTNNYMHINARIVKPLDEKMLEFISSKKIIVLEENSIIGGLFSQISAFYQLNKYKVDLTSFAVPDQFMPHGDIVDIFSTIGLDCESVARCAKQL